MSHLVSSKLPARHQGFSLIELMIALLLGSFLLLGVTRVLEANLQSSRLQQSYGRIQESGRMAIEMIQRDIRNADYWGCPSELKLIADGGTIANNLENGSVDIQDMLTGGGVSGIDNANGEKVGKKDVKDGTDIISLRSSESVPGLSITKTPNTNAAALLVNGGTSVDVCTVLLVTNCKSGDLFQRTSNAQANVINHNTGYKCDADTGATGNASKDFESKYGPDAKILKPTL
ncbi:MAG: prepilin-type N-terminal cleavage/methylation domain-containing protein, partial [Pseudomonadales bacterium]|nr:prepilin-type N-terminal cleavage/methylation domain-containing protein [Pseudomonadales bacterium]